MADWWQANTWTGDDTGDAQQQRRLEELEDKVQALERTGFCGDKQEICSVKDKPFYCQASVVANPFLLPV